MTAPRFLYLHGFGSTANSKKGVAVSEHFAARGVTIERLDLRVPSMERLAFGAMLERTREAMGGPDDRAILIGSSLGGLTACRVAEEDARVCALVLLAPALRAAEQLRRRVGEEGLAFYSARNLSDRPVTGIAVYNVTPEKVGRYFHKTACFCFDEQTLVPGQEMSFPLSFWVDPAILNDPDTRNLRTITLSYTFFRSMDDAAMASNAGPHVGRKQATP